MSKKYSDVLKYLRNDQPKEISDKPEVLEDLELIESIVKVADSRKANDIIVLSLRGVSDITDYVVIMDGNSKPQTQALLSTIEDELIVKHGKKGSIQGDAASGWALLDYGSIIVHVMFPKMRNFYKLEKKWKDAEILDISHLITENKAVNELDNQENEYIVKDETNDPFWNDF
eukprot:gene19831-25779_t